MTLTLEAVQAKLKPKPARLFIEGQWIDWDGPLFDQISPSNNKVLGSFAEAGERGVAMAVAAARKAFDEGPWPRMAAQDRKRILQRVIDGIYAAEEELAQLQTLDNGVPYTLSRNTRISGKACADMFDHYAGWIDKITGETYPQFSDASNMHYMSFREPVGVAGLITAWNGPLFMFGTKAGAALAAGCTVVLKPSENANLGPTKLAEILAEADLPPGVFNFVTGAGGTGAALSAHPDVDKISFTGSVATGQSIAKVAAPRMARLSLELGGKSAGIVFPEARSVAGAARTLMGLCSTFMSGQICSTSSRALVHVSLMDEFVHHAAEQVKGVRFGDPFDPATTSAPMITKGHVAKVLGYVESGQEQGATLAFGGDRPDGDLAEGNWINPAMFLDVRNNMRIAQEEIFGPVLSVIPFETEDEAIRIANDSAYGLAGSIFTADVTQAFRVARRIRSGSVGINGYASIPNAPMGGVKLSGIGREGGWPTIEAFTELKTLNFNLDA